MKIPEPNECPHCKNEQYGRRLVNPTCCYHFYVDVLSEALKRSTEDESLYVYYIHVVLDAYIMTFGAKKRMAGIEE